MSCPAAGDPSASRGRHLVLVGPTAVGKSEVAVELARRRIERGEPTEVVSADSMAVYRGMDVGTATPGDHQRRGVPHHLLDVVEVDQEYSVAQFAAAARGVLDEVTARGAAAVVVGGTGLYVSALVDGLEIPGRYPGVAADLAQEPTAELHRRLLDLDPVAAGRIEPGNRRRLLRALEVTIGSGRRFSSFGPGLDRYPPTPFVMVGLSVDRDRLAELIARRVRRQLDEGWLEEVRALAAAGREPSRTAAVALGYRELADHLAGRTTLAEAEELIVARTRRFAVRQVRWFRRDPRITWIDADAPLEDRVQRIDALWRGGA